MAELDSVVVSSLPHPRQMQPVFVTLLSHPPG